ncbi:MAG TPA: chain-length determining protein [Maritimibacter sp.]|nr:chain-length determining protein [Maritimibacter sp.]
MIPDDQGDSAQGLKTVLHWLREGKWIVAVAVAVSVVASVYIVTKVLEPVYYSTSKVKIEASQQPVISFESVAAGLSLSDSLAINSELEVLRSIRLLGKVVDALDLTTDPEFNPHLSNDTPPGVFARFLGPEPEAKTVEPSMVWTDTVSVLRDHIRATNIKETLVFSIRAQSRNPKKAALISNTLAGLYVQDQVEIKLEATQAASAWLSRQVAGMKSELEAADREVSAFRSSIDLVSADGLMALESQLKFMRDRLSRLNSQIAEIEERQNGLTYLTTVDGIADLYDDLDLERSDPDTAAFNARLDLLKRRDQSELERLLQQKSAIGISMASLEEDVEQQNRDAIRLEQLTREVEANRVLYEHFLTRMKETAAQEGIQQADSRILSQAIVPKFPSEPNKQLIVAMWTILGAVVGVSLVVLRNVLADTIKSPRDLETLSGQPIFGQIPVLASRSRTDFIRYLRKNPASTVAEAMRNFRTSILLRDTANPPRVIAMTSALPGEGKTSLSMALVQNYHGLGKKCLLIEGDMRRRVLTEVFEGKDPGTFLSVLSGQQKLADAVVRDDVLGADVLLAEKTDGNAADLFADERFAALLGQARDHYDLVVIDTPPILLVPDARIVVQHVDATILVVAWNRTTKQQVREAISWLEKSNQTTLGLVLNKINYRKVSQLGYGTNYARYGGGYYSG